MQQGAQYQEEPPATLSPPGAHFQNRNGAKGPEYQFERENTHPTAADAIFRSLFSALVSSSLLFMPQRGRDGCCVARLQLQEVAPFSKVIPETGGRECWQSSTVKSLPQLFFFLHDSKLSYQQKACWLPMSWSERDFFSPLPIHDETKYHEEISTFQWAYFKRNTEIIVTLIP